MEPIWNQKSSVNRDFSVLSGVIVFIALLTSLWVSYETFSTESGRIENQLNDEAQRLDSAFDIELKRGGYILESIGRQIIQSGTADKTEIAKMLRAFDSNNAYYSVFLWVDADLRAVTSSREGVLDSPIDLSDREYIQQAKANPFRIQVGKPIQGRVSQKLVIPLSMGLTDHTGKFLGSVTLSVDLAGLTEFVKEYIRSDLVGFTILSEDMNVMAHDEIGKKMLESRPIISEVIEKLTFQDKNQLVQRPTLLSTNRTFIYYYHSLNHPYIILTSLSSDYSAVRTLILPRVMQLLLVAAFLVSLLWLVRFRIIYPVQTLTKASSDISKGVQKVLLPKTGPLEITQLSQHLQTTLDYIGERKRVEQELIAKVIGLKTAKDTAEISDQAKTQILQLLRPEMTPSFEDVTEISALLLENNEHNDPDYTMLLEQLEHAAEHLQEVSHEIFTFTNTGDSHYLANRKPVDVGTLVHKCVGLLADTLDREEVAISIRLQEDLPRLSINELHLMHVVMHLLVACASAIPAGGELTVEASLEESNQGTEFALMFNDNATGLDSQRLADLWRSQLPKSQEALGKESTFSEADQISAVVLTKKIITLHNGRMTIQNPPDKESVISIYFPA